MVCHLARQLRVVTRTMTIRSDADSFLFVWKRTKKRNNVKGWQQQSSSSNNNSNGTKKQRRQQQQHTCTYNDILSLVASFLSIVYLCFFRPLFSFSLHLFPFLFGSLSPLCTVDIEPIPYMCCGSPEKLIAKRMQLHPYTLPMFCSMPKQAQL